MYMYTMYTVYCTCTQYTVYVDSTLYTYMMMCLFYMVEDNNTRVLFEKALSNIHSDQARYVSLFDSCLSIDTLHVLFLVKYGKSSLHLNLE